MTPLVHRPPLGHCVAMWRFLLAMTCLACASCAPEITCDDVGCTQGFVCDAASGECVAEINDCRVENTCRANEVCDAATGVCRPAEVKCADGNPCPTGLVCDGQTGVCKPAFRCSVDGCGAAENCDTRTEKCVPKPCSGDTECPETHVCEDQVCRIGCRPAANTCPAGQSCFFQTGDTFGVCQDDCVVDVDCPFGQRCTALADGNACTLEPACGADADCRPDEVCSSSACVQPPCASDADCLSTQICEIPSGTCINAACDEDVYGNTTPNHSRAAAFALPPASECPATATPTCVYDDLTLCPGRSDWFSVRATSNDAVRVRVEQATDFPDVDVFIWGAGGELLAQNTLLDPVSTVRVSPNRDQDLFLEIRPTTYDTSSYGLTVTREFCGNDTLEENDTPATATTAATVVDTPSELRAKTCGLDEDWFALPSLGEDHGLRIERTLTDTSLVVQLLTPDGHTFDIPRGSPVQWLRLGHAGDHLLRAYSALGLSSDYRISYTVTSAWECPTLGATRTPADAADAPLGTSMWTLCPDEDRWDAVHVRLADVGSGVVSVVVVPGADVPNLDVALILDGAATRVAAFDGAAYHLAARVPPNITDVIVRVTSDSGPVRLTQSPDFELTWSVQE